MNLEGIFLITHVLSLFCAIITLAIYNGTTEKRVSVALIRAICTCSLLASSAILLPPLTNNFDVRGTDMILCWTQGLILNSAWLMQQCIGFIMSLHMWFLIVRNQTGAERYYKYYFVFVFTIPILAISATLLIVFLTQSKIYALQLPFGIVPRNAYCFWSHPYAVRVVGYAGWYALFSIPGAVLSIWVAIFLLRYQFKSNNEVGVSTLYRTVVFASAYTLTISMSFIPSIKTIITYWPYGNGTQDDNTGVKFTEFSSSIIGVSLFLVFGTGEQGRLWFKRVFRLNKNSENNAHNSWSTASPKSHSGNL